MIVGVFVIPNTKCNSLQSLFLPPEVRPALRHYMEAVNTEHSGTDCMFWVDAYGRPLTKTMLCRKLKKWMMMHLRINFGSTDFRSLHDTAAADAYRNQIITLTEFNNLIAVNGHTTEISRKHYQALDAIGKCTAAHSSFIKYNGGIATTLLQAPIVVEVRTYGQHHSNQNPDCLRARWDEAELGVLEMITSRLKTFNPKQLMKLALEEIRGNEEYRKVFHQRHVANSSRLMAGYKQHLLVKSY